MECLECIACSIKDGECLRVGLPESRKLRQRLECKQFLWEEMLGSVSEGACHDETGKGAKVDKGMSRVQEDPISTKASENVKLPPLFTHL